MTPIITPTMMGVLDAAGHDVGSDEEDEELPVGQDTDTDPVAVAAADEETVVADKGVYLTQRGRVNSKYSLRGQCRTYTKLLR